MSDSGFADTTQGRRRRRRTSGRQARAYLRAITSTQAIIELRPDGTIIDANPNFLATVGYTLSDVVGRHHRMFVPEAEHESTDYQQFWARLAAGHPNTGIYRRIAAGGRDIWIQGSYTPICDRHGRVYKIIKQAVDVTESQRQQADLNGQLEAINRSQAVISFKPDGTIIDANDNFLNALGYRRDEIVGHHHRMFVQPDERESDEYRRFWEGLRQGQYKSELFARLHKDGSLVWIQASYNPIFDPSGQPFKIVKYATDVTTQHRAVAHLHSSLTTLSDTVPAIASDARTAGESSTDAAGRAQDGDDIVEQLVNRISAINDRASDMARIVDTLDSLAFQTNILALNASVEAARAGQHGRGFGVVAQEVRQLSNHSAEAARNIASLIRDVTGSLGECSNGAEQTRGAMRRMVEAATQVDTRIQQIAKAAETQANGLSNLNHTLLELEAPGT